MGTVSGQQRSDAPPGDAPLDVSEEGDEKKIKPVNFKDLAQDGHYRAMLLARDADMAGPAVASAKTMDKVREVDETVGWLRGETYDSTDLRALSLNELRPR